MVDNTREVHVFNVQSMKRLAVTEENALLGLVLAVNFLVSTHMLPGSHGRQIYNVAADRGGGLNGEGERSTPGGRWLHLSSLEDKKLAQHC